MRRLAHRRVHRIAGSPERRAALRRSAAALCGGKRGLCGMAVALLAGATMFAGGPGLLPRAGAAGDDGQQPAPGGGSSFRSGAVAVDQPVTLPAGAPDSSPNPAAAGPVLPGAGTGWLGMTADDQLVAGRVSVVDVAADGPAAKAGIRPADVLLELDGKPLRQEEDLAAALAAIAPGQRVTAAVGRDNRIDEVVLTAAPRPADPRTRPWPDAVAAATPPAVGQPVAGQPVVGSVPLPAAAPAAPAMPSLPPPPTPLPPGRSVLVPAEPAPTAVIPVAGEERAPLAAVPPAIAPPAVTATPGWGGAPAPAAAPRMPAAVAVPPALPAAVPPAITAAAPPPAVGAPSGPPAVSAWGGAPSPAPAATSQLPQPVSRPAPGTLPAAVAPTFSAAAPRSGPAAAPGRLALGVRTVPVDAPTQSRFRLSETGGALVIGVVHDLPASRAGVPPGSVIVALNNVPVRSPQELTQVVSGGTPGVPVPIQYVLPGGEARRADVVLVPLEASLERALAGPTVAAESGVALPAGGPVPNIARRAVDTLPMVTAQAPSAAVLTGGAVPPPGAPLERLEALLRRINERLDAVESRLDRIERLGR